MKRVRVAVIDSGVHPDHPHLGGVIGGVGMGPEGETSDYLDRLGHGTAVAAAIREKAPEVDLFAVKIFHRRLSTRIETLVRALDWCVGRDIDLVNLSLGTTNPCHREAISEAVSRLAAAGAILVSAQTMDGREALPGSLEGVLGVDPDVRVPRETYRCAGRGKAVIFLASPYPRPIPGVPPEHNLLGPSFAVANMTGFVAQARMRAPQGHVQAITRYLVEQAAGGSFPQV